MQIENDAQDARRSATTLSAAHHTFVQSAMPERCKKISMRSRPTDVLSTRLLYGCGGMLWNAVQTRELDIIWNNAFRCILTVVGVNQSSIQFLSVI